MDIIRHRQQGAVMPSHTHVMAWRDALNKWSEAQDNPGTRRNYAVSVRSFFETPGAPQTIEGITDELLTAWRGAMVARQQLEPGHAGRITTATANRHLAAMKSFLRYWIARNTQEHTRVAITGDILNSICKSIKGNSEKRYDVLSKSEAVALVTSARTPCVTVASQGRKGWHPTYTDLPILAKRDGAIILLALGTGCRVAELASLNVSDISQEVQGDSSVWWLHVRQGKGNKDRFIPISDTVARDVADYIEATGRSLSKASDKDMPIWLSRRNKRLSVDHMRAIIDSASDRAAGNNTIGRDKVISPHSLRHTYAMDVLEGNEKQGRRPGTLLEVKELLGHANVATTQRYLDHIDKRKLAVLAPQVID